MWDRRKSNQAKGDMWAPCPFHQEKTASFHVDDRKGFYYCFGCQAKGDIVSFVQETENVGFMEAVELLARDAGMSMPARDPKAAEKADRATQLAKATEAAVGHFRLQLKTQGAAEARAYLERRGTEPGDSRPVRDRVRPGIGPHRHLRGACAKGMPHGAPDRGRDRDETRRWRRAL
jgi:DNA primase